MMGIPATSQSGYSIAATDLVRIVIFTFAACAKPENFYEPNPMYHLHLRAEETETIITALARMAAAFPKTAKLCDKAADSFGSAKLSASYILQRQIFADLKDANKITWTCHVCGKERPDARISVFKRDISQSLGLPTGIAFENVRYCNDSDSCFQKAQTYRHLRH